MDVVSQTTSPLISGTLSGAVHLSRAVVEGLLLEMQNADLSRRKTSSEAIGLLFGTVDAASVHVEQFEPLKVGDVGTSILAIGESRHEALVERISAIRSGAVQSPKLLGWYVFRADSEAGLLDRDVAIHNEFFQDDHDVAVTLKREAKGQFAVEVYAAKPGVLLSKNSYRLATWHSANFDGLPEQLSLILANHGNDQLFLNVYRTTKSLEESEFGGNWGRIRRYTARLIPSLGEPARAGQDRFLVSDLNANRTTAPTMPTALVPDQRPPSFSEGRPQLQPWLPQSLPAPPSPGKKNLGFLRTAAWLLGTIVISVLTYIAAHLYLKPMLLNLASQASAGTVAPPAKTVPAQPVLGLQVSQNGTALELQWNPLYPPIQQAASGKLIINDGIATREIELDQAQLRSGRIVYIPTSGDVRFSLKFLDATSHTVTDSIRVLATPAEKTPNGGRRYRREQAAIIQDAKSATIGNSQRSGVIESSSGTDSGQPRTSSSFQAATENGPGGSPEKIPVPLMLQADSSVPQSNIIAGLAAASRQSPPAPAESLKPAPQKQSVSTLSPQDLPLPDRRQVNLKIAPALPDRKVASSAPQPQQQPGPSSVSSVQLRAFTAPVAVYRQYPTLRHGLLFENVVVPVIVHIDQTGKVMSVALAPSSNKIRPDIAKQALAAAREWHFSPAKLGDKAVSSEMKIIFVFKPSQGSDGIAP